jgi:hypothetical protein
LKEVNVHGGCEGEEDAETGHTNEWRESHVVVNAFASSAALGNEPIFEPENVAELIGLNLVNPHVVDDPADLGKVNKGPCVVRLKGVELLRGVGAEACLG